MNTAELRLGIYILDCQSRKPVKVTEHIIVECCNGMDFYEPIPINTERLERFGFEMFPDWTDKRKDGSVAFMDLGYLFLAQGMMGSSVTIFDNQGLSTGVHLDYVHQVQNAVFMLTNKELEITTEKQNP